MKILMLHDEEGRAIAVDLLKQLEKYAIDGEAMLLEGNWESFGSSLEETLGAATHVVAICSQAGSSSAVPSGFAFAAGFACGARLPFLLYGDDALSLGPLFANDPLRFRSEADFLAYLVREAEGRARGQALKQARETLLEQGIPLTAASLGQCVRERNREAVKLFLQAGFSPDTLDNAGVPLICLAARAGDREITALLLERGASVNCPAGDRGGAAIIDAALGKHTDILGDLLGAGADINAKSKDGQSALIIVVGLNDEPSAELLLKAGANVDDPDSLGVSARKYAALFNRPGMVKLFQTYAPPGSEIKGGQP